jgi:hypothetical protein
MPRNKERLEQLRRLQMKAFVKPAIVLGLAGAMALGSMTASQARSGHHRAWVAGAAGFAAGAAIGAAAANSNYYYGSRYGYYGGPAYAYTGDPAYAGYDAYAYAPGYRGGYGYGYDASTQSAPAHYDPGYGYNSNTLAPWQDRKLQGSDY